MTRTAVVLLAAALVLAACGGSDDGDAADGVEVVDGYDAEVALDGLVAPTQISEAPDGRILVAQLNGGESDGAGQIVAVDLDRPEEREVLFDGLLKPTGVTVVGDEVWVMEERSLSRGPLVGGELEVVLDELPYNGRSEGTLTTTEDGRLLYNTSGSLFSRRPAEGSGTLFSLVPGEEPAAVADGFKHAYARTFGGDGTLWQTEMSDGSFDGRQAPDELVAVEPGDTFGWPACIGDREPVEEYGGTEERCQDEPRSHAVFEPGASPTSVAVAPWDSGVLLVALWNEGRVVTVPTTSEGAPHRGETFLTGLAHPQHLLVVGDRLLVVDLDGGRIFAVSEAD